MSFGQEFLILGRNSIRIVSGMHGAALMIPLCLGRRVLCMRTLVIDETENSIRRD